MKFFRFLILAILELSMGLFFQAQIYYVSTNGSDANNGNINAPWLTIQFAIDQVQPGDTIFVRSGTYNEYVIFNQSGNSGQPIILSGYPNELVVLDGNNLNWRYGIDLSENDNLVIQDLTIRDYIRDGLRGFGVVGWGSNNNIIVKNLVLSLVGTPIKFAAAGSEISSNIEIKNITAFSYDGAGIDLGPERIANVLIQNVILDGPMGGSDTSVDGIAVEDGDTISIQNVILRGHAGDGVDLKADNVTVQQVDARYYARDGAKLWGQNVLLENSIFLGGVLEGLTLPGAGPYVIRNNIFGIANGYGYTAVIGPYESNTPSSQATLIGNIFYTPQNQGTLIYLSPAVSLNASHNVYYSPNREDAVITAYINGQSQSFSKDQINDSTWSQNINTDQNSRFLDPLFLDVGNINFQLQSSSALIDQIPSNLVSNIDLLGRLRPNGLNSDIGPYEYYGSQSTPIVSNILKKKSQRFVLRILGNNFQSGLKVYVGGLNIQWNNVVYKDSNEIRLKKGKRYFPKDGAFVLIKIVNPDGQQVVVAYDSLAKSWKTI